MNEPQLRTLVENALAEDIGDGDHSTLATISASAKGKAVLLIKQPGLLAGMQVAAFIFNMKSPGVVFTALKKDGEPMVAGEKAFEVQAPVHVILQCERLVLNCMQRMSGIATLTNEYVKKLSGYKTEILDTRKTTPNFRLLEKEAVRIGGGVNHRFGLYDMIMLKDNHIDYHGSIEGAVEAAWRYVQEKKPGLKIEVETRTLEDVKKVISQGKADRIMLDNFSPELLREAMKIINGKMEAEASGGISLDNIISYAETGVDYVSVGGLIHQARSLDLSLKAVVV